MVVAPEHQMIANCKLQIANIKEVENILNNQKINLILSDLI
jgi:hypothetical protein